MLYRTRHTLPLVAAVALLGCPSPSPKAYNQAQFASAVADSICRWVTKCCDSAETSTFLGGTADCRSVQQSKYLAYFQSAKAQYWDSEGAASCADSIGSTGSTCERAFDPETEVSSCGLVSPTKKAGDLCETSFDCSTEFCKNGVCANPLSSGSTCKTGEVCASGLKCVSGVCKGLQVDGSACTTGSECISAACGGGKCIVSPTYTCDGK
jgi:hypothetical protein